MWLIAIQEGPLCQLGADHLEELYVPGKANDVAGIGQ
jgi:hypothetical protein